MNTTTAGYLVIFGMFTLLLGVIGYITHPEKAITALVFGGGFGVLWMLWGILSARGVRLSWLGALATTALMILAGVWRASVSWLAVVNGQPDKGFPAIVITLMLVVACFMMFFLLRDHKTGAVENWPQGAQ